MRSRTKETDRELEFSFTHFLPETRMIQKSSAIHLCIAVRKFLMRPHISLYPKSYSITRAVDPSSLLSVCIREADPVKSSPIVDKEREEKREY